MPRAVAATQLASVSAKNPICTQSTYAPSWKKSQATIGYTSPRTIAPA